MLTSSDRTTFRPLQRYEQIAERLADDIRSGVLAPGERLPSERDLARTLEVSRASVREALGQVALGGQPLAGLQQPHADLAGDPIGDPLVELAGLERP